MKQSEIMSLISLQTTICTSKNIVGILGNILLPPEYFYTCTLMYQNSLTYQNSSWRSKEDTPRPHSLIQFPTIVVGCAGFHLFVNLAFSGSSQSCICLTKHITDIHLLYYSLLLDRGKTQSWALLLSMLMGFDKTFPWQLMSLATPC